MLDRLIDAGDDKLISLRNFKKFMSDIRDDILMREPVTRRLWKTVSKRLEQANEPDLLTPLKDDYSSFQRANDWESGALGPMSIEARIMLMEKLLVVQAQSGYELIDQEEFDAILVAWREDGYEVSLSDLLPRDWSLHGEEWNYPGAIVLHPDASLNTKRTTNHEPVFTLWEDFLMGSDELIAFLHERSRVTKKTIYYELTYWDMREHSKMDDDFVWNQAHFIISGPGITTREHASKFLADWLGYNDPPQSEQPNWDSIAENLYQQACQLVTEPNFDRSRLEYMNQNLELLGHPTVSVPLMNEINGQLQFELIA